MDNQKTYPFLYQGNNLVNREKGEREYVRCNFVTNFQTNRV